MVTSVKQYDEHLLIFVVAHCLDKNMQQRLLELALYEFWSPFVGQDMMEIMQNAKFIRHM
jgi:hypothetical protein